MTRDLSFLPLPVARLVRRSRNAKSSKDRHDGLYYALEVSVRIAAAAQGSVPRDLRRAPLGAWVDALPTRGSVVDRGDLLRLYRLFTEVGTGRADQRRSILEERLFSMLPAYRNRVIGHGSVRATSYYDHAAPILEAGLYAAWETELFLPSEARMVQVEDVRLTAAGRQARVLSLDGEAVEVLHPAGTEVPEHVLPGRVYARFPGAWQELHPWLLFQEGDARSHSAVYCFNGFGRRGEYLDYASGDLLRGDELERVFPGVEAELAERCGVRRGDRVAEDAPAKEGESGGEPALEGGRRTFGNFVLLGKLGEGGMGVVYLALQQGLDRLVALKLLPPGRSEDARAVDRFRREIQALSRCEHPHVVKVHTSGQIEGTWFYAMEYVQGTTLAQVAEALSTADDFTSAISTACEKTLAEYSEMLPNSREIAERPLERARGVRRFRQAARFFRDAACGLHHLHEQGILHRDLKPSNIMVTHPAQRAVIMDLGLAALEDAASTWSRDARPVVGTLRYMAPEQLQRSLVEIDRRADLYALGATLYEFLTDRPFLDGDTEPRLIEQILRENPPAADRVDGRVPHDLALIVGKATRKDPGERYATAREMADDLGAWLEGRPIRARKPSAGYLLRCAARRHAGVVTTAAASFVLLVGSTFGFISELQDEIADRKKAEELERTARLEHDAQEGIAVSAWLQEGARDLWPADSSMVAPLEKWLQQADEEIEHAAEYRAELATPESSVDREGIEAVLESLEVLRRVRGEVAARLERARTLYERSVGAYRAEWDAAIAAVRRSEHYGGFEIEPQPGLVPLGADPATGFWDFWVIDSGTRPQPDPETSRWIIGEETGVVLVLLPGDRGFMFGSRDKAQNSNQDVCLVDLHPFLISKYETTQAQYERIMASNPSTFRSGTGKLLRGESFWFDGRHPVDSVTWFQASEFARRLGLLLPTEVQWEFACRGGTRSLFYAGSEVPALAGFENVRDQSYKIQNAKDDPKAPWNDGAPYTGPVGAYQPNPYGLFDMAGNVTEWCRDTAVTRFGTPRLEGGEGALAGDRTRIGPPSKDQELRLRGGNWNYPPSKSRSTQRYQGLPEVTNPGIGFRVVRPLEPCPMCGKPAEGSLEAEAVSLADSPSEQM